jgi:hypothetical protein
MGTLKLCPQEKNSECSGLHFVVIEEKRNSFLFSSFFVLGSSINDVTALGGGGQGFCDNSTNASVIKSATMGEG